MRRFELHRDQDVTGVSGEGVVADGVEFPDGTVALRWRGGWPTSVVFHDRGIEAVEAVHGHGGATRIVWLDAAPPTSPAAVYRHVLHALNTAHRGITSQVVDGKLPAELDEVLDRLDLTIVALLHVRHGAAS